MKEPFLELPDLACEDVGGAAIACNDEFFAEKENLLRAHAAEWKDHAYTDRGKWMDGWETRRRREVDPFAEVGPERFDWCIVRLGMPGAIHGIVVDTAWFRGNFPASCRLWACEANAPLDLAGIDDAAWVEIVPHSPLRGDTQNAFTVAATAQRFTHVRLEIFPDGGVARLRVHGEVIARWDRLRALGGAIDLAALELGAVVESCSDMFFGSRNNLIKPGRSRSMADGWETRRRRGPGNDWAIIKLATAGTIERVELDTSHFKGNAPGGCTVEGRASGGEWRLMLRTPLQPHTRHVFDRELRRIGDVTHLRLSVFPDGGMARLRAHGTPARRDDGGLGKLAAMSEVDATRAFTRCCGSAAWARAMTAARPFEDESALLRIADRSWWSLGEADHLEAFAAHPKIGETKAQANEPAAWSASEQASAKPGIAELAELNRTYEAKYGFIYIVCAQGRSGDDLLAVLRERLANSRAHELRTAGEEQLQITRLRLAKLLEELA
jgi:allantoicase